MKAARGTFGDAHPSVAQFRSPAHQSSAQAAIAKVAQVAGEDNRNSHGPRCLDLIYGDAWRKGMDM
jgi:hypothetical protein